MRKAETRRAVAIRHVAFEDLGILGPILAARGYDVVYREAGLAALDQHEAMEADLLVVLGGPIGVYEEAIYPFLGEEIGLLERRLAADRPTLGICLGCQLIARALGARVYPSGIKEIGWGPLVLTAAGEQSALRFLAPAATEVLHWHGDTFDLPAGARLLASTERCVNQAFAAGNALALQFHAEVEMPGLERWFIGHACEIAATAGIDVAGLRLASAREGPRLARAGRAMFEAWLDELGTRERRSRR